MGFLHELRALAERHVQVLHAVVIALETVPVIRLIVHEVDVVGEIVQQVAGVLGEQSSAAVASCFSAHNVVSLRHLGRAAGEVLWLAMRHQS